MVTRLTKLKSKTRKLGSAILRPLFLDLGGDHRDSIFVAGTERSGTTWLADLVNYRSSFRLIFEPFWASRVPECGAFSAQQYLRPDEGGAEFLEPARKILGGSVRNPWFDKFHRAFVTRRRVVKDVRANLLLNWLSVQFPGMPIVLIIRHPCAVASSQKQAKHRFGSLQDHFLNQPKLVEDFLDPFMDTAQNLETPFEERVFRWCIQNYVPLTQFGYGDIHVIFYEELCVRPEATLKALFEYLALPLDLDKVDLLAPSPVSRPDSAVVTGESLVDKWRDFVTPDEVDRAIKILQLFGLDSLYDNESLPNSDRLREFMKESKIQTRRT